MPVFSPHNLLRRRALHVLAFVGVVSLTSTSVALASNDSPSEAVMQSLSSNSSCAPKRTVQGGHVVLAFTSTGVCDWTVPAGISHIDFTVVAGGGGGGSRASGGGGAGGLLTATHRSVSGVSALTITVGAGGAGGPAGQSSGGDGGTSSMSGSNFTTVSAVGGGGGGITGRDGGSGGGAAGGFTLGSSNTVGNGTAGQGSNGGAGRNGNCAGSTTKWCGGGGGGAGAVGGAGVLNGAGGAGGIGRAISWITSATARTLAVGEVSSGLVYFAGGGGGGGDHGGAAGARGIGGGGAGSISSDASGGDAIPNTGGGGGGSGYHDANGAAKGGDGASGVVVIRYSVVPTTCAGTTSYAENSYIVVAFTAVQTNCTWTVPPGVSSIDYLVVAGGGGGGARHGGGGGAGGLLTSNAAVVAGSPLTVTVGGGGAGASANESGATNGGNSSIAQLGQTIAQSIGGGRQNATGGSGGGAAAPSNFQSVGSGTAGQGNAGGFGASDNACTGGSSRWCGGGGGGAGAVGQAADFNNNNRAGNGGIGLTTSLFSVTAAQFMDVGHVSGGAVYFAGGGGGGVDSGGTAGSGGLGGGANGSANQAVAPTAAMSTTGGGGGGGAYGSSGNSGGSAGGSGVVVIRYTPSAPGSVVDSAAWLNGSSQYFEVAEGTAFVSRAVYTAESWIFPTSTTCATMCPIFSHEGDYTLGIHNNNFRAVIHHTNTSLSNTWSTNVTAKANEWQHVALVRDGATARLFVNGQLRGSLTLGGAGRSTYSTAYPLSLGRQGTAYYTGRIDQFRLWSTARIASELATGMHEHTPSTTTGLIAQYDFNNVTSTTVNNTAPSPGSGTNITAFGTPLYRDVKSTSFVGSDVVVTFPRSYLTSAGGWTVPDGVSNPRAIVVGGGGGGGSSYDNVAAGGGGAGGLINRFTSNTVQFTASTVRVTVGAGGFGAGPGGNGSDRSQWQISGNSGQNSVLDALTAVGGGAGGGRFGNGGNGGSGGGAGGRSASYVGGTATAGQGNNGGRALVDASSGGGGGGVGGTGGASNGATIGVAGNGVSLAITGGAVTYAVGGTGGNRASNTTTASSGTVNTGGGGAGGNGVSTGTVGGYGGDGGSGVVIVRYARTMSECSPVESRVGAHVVVTFAAIGECTWNVPAGVTAVDYLVVAGGGGGGAYQGLSHGGGGGAGGVRDGNALTVTPTQPLTIAVGAGGTGGFISTDGAGDHGDAGENSTLSGAGITAITAIGGGYGAGDDASYSGGPGGSGGGGLGSQVVSGSGGTGTAGPPRQGFNGGNNNASCGVERPAGGGGGASAAGGNASCVNDQSGAGGAGRTIAITGSDVVYGGGGGGSGMGVSGRAIAGTGGSGGGGAGGGIRGANGIDGQGGGGGGAGYSTSVNVNVMGGDGGDGVVVLRYVDRIISIVQGDAQTGTATDTAAVNPRVQVVDAVGNGVDGITVTFTPGTDSGAVGSASVATSGGGFAETSWTFGIASSQTIDATMSLAGSGSVTFTATVTTSFNISYDANGGTGAPVQASADIGSTATVSLTVPTQTGYTFSSWNTLANGTGTQYASGATFTMPASAVTLFAQWTINSHNVIYDANSGSGAPSSASLTFGSTVTISATRPTRVGHTFTGWNTALNGSGTSYSWDGSAFTPSTFTLGDANVTLYAQWSVNSYTVTYDANNGTGAPSAQTADYNTSITVSSVVPTLAGHTFSGWNTAANGSGASAASSSSYTVLNDVTLFAQWSVNSYTVTYDANSGSGAPSSASLTFGSTVTISATRPTRVGHTFTGWNTALNGSGTSYSWDGSAFTPSTFTLGDANVTLFAQWSVNSYTVTYDANNGTGAPSAQTADYNTSITVSSVVPTREGHTFTGWNTAANGSGSDYSSNTSLLVTDNVTLFAKWAVNTYSISYDANNGTGAPVTASGIQFDTSVTLSSTVPTRAGYTFTDWNTAANGSGTSYVSGAVLTMPANNISLFAQWTATVQTITYDANNGTGAPSVANVATDATATVSSSLPVRDGYTFLRWNTAANGSGIDYSSGATFTMGATNITLFAVWLANTYSVIYDANGGVSPPAASSAQTDATFTVSSSLPTRAGYTLVSWNMVRNGSGTHYAPSSTFTMPANAVTLFAQWSANANNLVYNANGGTGAPSTSVATTDSTTTVSATVPTRSGYSFTGWNTAADGSGASYASGASFTMPTTHLSLFAQWTLATYQVIYDANGGSGAPTPSSGVYLSNITLSSVAPTYTGYTFLGWGTLANGLGTNYAAGGSFSVPAQNTTLFAVWVADINDVYYVMNGGADGPSSVVASTGSSVTLSVTIPTRTGYSFTGWNTAVNGSGTAYAWNGSVFSASSFVMPGSDVFLFAQWSINSYTVSYDVNGGTGVTPTSQSGQYLSSLTLATPSLTRSGWTFVGWNSAANGSGTQFAPGGTLTIGTSNVTMYAEWTRNVNAVIFDALGGASEPEVRFGATGTTVTLPNNVPVREGHTFLRWEDSTQTAHSPGSSFTMPVSSVTLFAQWSINSYVLTYNVNGGIGTVPAPETIEFSSTATVSATSLSRDGFTFAQWNTDPNGSGTSYVSAASFAMPARDVTLYAQWIPVVVIPTTTTTSTTVVQIAQVPATQKSAARPSAPSTTVVTPTTTTTTTVPEVDSPPTTVVPAPIDTESDDPPSGSPIMWLLIALVALLLAAFGVRQLRR